MILCPNYFLKDASFICINDVILVLFRTVTMQVGEKNANFPVDFLLDSRFHTQSFNGGLRVYYNFLLSAAIMSYPLVQYWEEANGSGKRMRKRYWRGKKHFNSFSSLFLSLST